MSHVLSDRCHLLRRTPGPVYDVLPPPLATFSRSNALKDLLERLPGQPDMVDFLIPHICEVVGEGTNRIVLLSGVSGVGKSAAARAVGDMLGCHNSPAFIFLSLNAVPDSNKFALQFWKRMRAAVKYRHENPQGSRAIVVVFDEVHKPLPKVYENVFNLTIGNLLLEGDLEDPSPRHVFVIQTANLLRVELATSSYMAKVRANPADSTVQREILTAFKLGAFELDRLGGVFPVCPMNLQSVGDTISKRLVPLAFLRCCMPNVATHSSFVKQMIRSVYIGNENVGLHHLGDSSWSPLAIPCLAQTFSANASINFRYRPLQLWWDGSREMFVLSSRDSPVCSISISSGKSTGIRIRIRWFALIICLHSLIRFS